MSILVRELEELDTSERFHLDTLSKIRKRRNEIYNILIEKEYKIYVGCVIQTKGETYKITKIRPRPFNIKTQQIQKPWVSGVRKTKKGQWTKREYCIYTNWEVSNESI